MIWCVLAWAGFPVNEMKTLLKAKKEGFRLDT